MANSAALQSYDPIELERSAYKMLFFLIYKYSIKVYKESKSKVSLIKIDEDTASLFINKFNFSNETKFYERHILAPIIIYFNISYAKITSNSSKASWYRKIVSEYKKKPWIRLHSGINDPLEFDSLKSFVNNFIEIFFKEKQIPKILNLI